MGVPSLTSAVAVYTQDLSLPIFSLSDISGVTILTKSQEGGYCSGLRRLSKFDLGALLYAFCWSVCVSGILRHRCLVLSIH